MAQSRQVVDLQSFASAYIRTPKISSSRERKIIGDSRPMMTEVVRSLIGTLQLDAYMVVEGGSVRIYQPQQTPAVALVKPPDAPDLSIEVSLYVIDGRTFEMAAAARKHPVLKGVPEWFVAPRQHADDIKAAVVALLDQNLEPALREIGLV